MGKQSGVQGGGRSEDRKVSSSLDDPIQRYSALFALDLYRLVLLLRFFCGANSQSVVELLRMETEVATS